MRVAFMGTPAFAVPSLRALAARHEVVLVFTQPDAVSRRGDRLVPPPVRVVALELGLTVHQPETLRDRHVMDTLRIARPDVICVAAYGRILPRDILDLPPHGCINVHASLLPRHRGAAPIERAILAGDEVTGVSIMRMEEGLDTGPYARQVSIPIGEMNARELSEALARCGADALLAVLDDIAEDSVTWIPQDERLATHAPKITRNDVAVDPSLGVRDALRRIRASSDRATTRVSMGGRTCVLIQATLSDTPVPQGLVRFTHAGPVMGFADGALLITALTPAGRPEMSGAAFVRGLSSRELTPWEPA